MLAFTALEEGGDVNGAAESFALASQYAQFALVDSVEKFPLDLDLAGTADGSAGSSDGGGESDLQGGPNVVDGVPDDATYWASGGFDSEEAARSDWEDGKGAVQSGQSYVHTFDTTGAHEYFCIPHEDAGMVGTVIVE